jgi:hypothetical protein
VDIITQLCNTVEKTIILLLTFDHTCLAFFGCGNWVFSRFVYLQGRAEVISDIKSPHIKIE